MGGGEPFGVLMMFLFDLSTGCYGSVHFAKIQQAGYLLLYIHLYINTLILKWF